MSEDDFDETQVVWNAPKPSSEEVTEQQYSDFEKTFSTTKSKLDDLLKIKNSLIAERERLQEEGKAIENKQKSVNEEIEACIQKSNDIPEKTVTKKKAPPKKKSRVKAEDQEEMLILTKLLAEIEEQKKKNQKLEKKFNEEKRAWKYEEKNLESQKQELINQQIILKQTIQAYDFLVRKEQSSSNDEIFDERQEENSYIFSSDYQHKPVASPLKSQSPSSRICGMEEENAKHEMTNSSLKVQDSTNSHLFEKSSSSSPIQSQNSTMRPSLFATPLQLEEQKQYQAQLLLQPQLKPKPPEPQFDIKEFNFMPEKYKIDFTYQPLGHPIETTKVNGRTETLYQNGDKMIEYKNQVKRIICRDGTIYTRLTNGDVSKKFTDGAEAYFFDQSRAIQLTLPDNVIHSLFSNGQKEISYPNNEKITVFPDQSIQYKKPNGDYQINYSNGKSVTCINGIITDQ